jgi:hypothetical protein
LPSRTGHVSHFSAPPPAQHRSCGDAAWCSSGNVGNETCAR